jgi:anaerobic magnesium-protoporphyrin IX monomethyl ester cyclase
LKILLVYPYFLDKRIDEEDVSAVPMGLYFVGAMLRAHGYRVDIFNAFDSGRTTQQIDTVLRQYKPDVVGFSILHANRWGGIDIARRVKAIDPKCLIVFGGVGATFLWEHFLNHFQEIDYIVRGEGEHSFLELIRFLEKKKQEPPIDIPGIAFRQGDKPFKTADREPVADMDSLPMPADYFQFQHVSLTRGCPADCTFCGSPSIWKRRVRFHSPDYFVSQITKLYKKGITFFFVSDDTFTLKKELVIAICKQIIQKQLPIAWAAISRVDCVDAEMLGWMRRAGCTQISYGIESGSHKIRKLFKKRISDGTIVDAFSLTARFGMMARAYFIYGAPGESEETIEESLEIIRKIRPLSAIFYMLDLFPGTELYEAFKKRSGANDDIWLERVEDILYFETDDSLSKESVLAFGKKLRKGYFSMLPEFTKELELEDDPQLYPLHADFLSRLALTFSHGDYANNPWIKNSRETAIPLYKRSLSYHPDHRAFWGLGLVYQQLGRFEESAAILQKGIRYHPASIDLNLTLAQSLIRSQRHGEARRYLEPFPDHPQVVDLLVRCSRMLKDRESEKKWMDQLKKIGR